MEIRLSQLIGPAFSESHRAVKDGALEIVESGGRGSGKSSYLSIEFLLQLIRHPDCHGAVRLAMTEGGRECGKRDDVGIVPYEADDRWSPQRAHSFRETILSKKRVKIAWGHIRCGTGKETGNHILGGKLWRFFPTRPR